MARFSGPRSIKNHTFAIHDPSKRHLRHCCPTCFGDLLGTISVIVIDSLRYLFARKQAYRSTISTTPSLVYPLTHLTTTSSGRIFISKSMKRVPPVDTAASCLLPEWPSKNPTGKWRPGNRAKSKVLNFVSLKQIHVLKAVASDLTLTVGNIYRSSSR